MKTGQLTATLVAGITLCQAASAETIIHNVNLVTMGDDGLVAGKAVIIDEGREPGAIFLAAFSGLAMPGYSL